MIKISMDTSIEYINMCTKAIEVQERWQHLPGDFFTTGYCEVATISQWNTIPPHDYSIINNDHETLERETPLAWLPKQDQLQELLFEVWNGSISLQIKIGYITDFFDTYNEDQIKTMEQVWLALLMKERYNKLWNGEDWEEIE